jgi:uncharacterized protein (DUF302 family)
MLMRYFVVALTAATLAVAATLGSIAIIRSYKGEKERTMNSKDLPDADLVTLPSSHGVTETIERLKTLVDQKKIHVFAHIDHAAGAEKVGQSLRPTQVLIFGNPQAGTPLMQSRQTIGLDLPLRVLVYEDAAGKVWLSYHRPSYLAKQYQVSGIDEAVKALDDGLAALTRAAAGQ